MFLDHSDPHAIALCYQGGQHGCMDEQGAHRVVKGTKDTFSFDVWGEAFGTKIMQEVLQILFVFFVFFV